jgi:chitooligosaccharide synthase NodC
MISSFTVVGRAGLDSLFIVYSVWVMLHLVVQAVLAHRHWLSTRATAEWVGPWPSVTVICPTYNEGPDELRLCLQSLVAQDYEGRIDVHVVDDLSANRDEVMPVLDEFGALPGWRIHLPSTNGGKRAAQDLAVRDSGGDLVLTIDSDTQLAPDAVRQLVLRFSDETLGAATGDVRVSNARDNLLTRLIDLRYWVAFNQERASHALYGAVLCCSGPLSMYRRSVIDEVWDRYTAQSFRGIECTYGDDRHLTNLVLGSGLRTTFVPDARCITSAPTTIQQYLRQQLRWNKSYYRELLWTLAFLPRLRRFMWFEVITQAVLPMLLALSVVATIVRSFVYGADVLLWYAVLIAVMAVLHCLYAAWRLRSVRPFMFVLYGFLHAAVLIPLRLRALSSLTDNAWGTRGAAADAPEPTVPVAVPVPVPVVLPESQPVPVVRTADGSKLVLVVDDEQDVRELVARKLQASGFQVVTAENGQRALEVLAQQQPDLMLLDVMMPGLSGFDVCRSVKEDRGDSAPPVIFLSARSQDEDISEGMAAGAEDYVVKPFSPADLVRRSVDVLERQR